jgi:hypothetical protein
MSPRPKPHTHQVAAPTGQHRGRRWLLFVHQLPPRASNLRVRVWRRLQQIGAVVIKQAVYALPDSPGAREDFEWLKTEVEGANGHASVFAAESLDTWSDDALVEEFRRSRQDAYAEIARDAEQVLGKPRARRTRTSGRPPVTHRVLDAFRQRCAAIERVDFFGSAGRDHVLTLLDQLAERLARGGSSPAIKTNATAGNTDKITAYQRRVWVTRPRPGVDRMASAWLISRFIDSEARFSFAPDREAAPRDTVPFDMFGVEFSHRGDDCTFETLSKAFKISDGAVRRIADLVHDLDLKDGRFGAPEAAAIGVVIEGLQFVHADDDALLAQGMTLFEALYRSFEQSARRVGPRPLARQATKRRRSKGSSR